MSSLIKNLLFALGLAVIIWLGYSVFFSSDEADLSVQSAQSLNAELARDAQAFNIRLQQLKATDFSSVFFEDRRYKSLVDNTVELTPEPVGRDNPFAPITSK